MKTPVCVASVLFALSLSAQASAPTAPLAPGDPISLPGTGGRYDFIRVDTVCNCLLLGHEGNKTFDVFDVASRKLLNIRPNGTWPGPKASKRGYYYMSGNDPGRMVIVDVTRLEIVGGMPLLAKTDWFAFDLLTGLAYECNDTSSDVRVIDPAAEKIVATINVDGSGVEDMVFDPGYQRLYQAVNGKNTITVIDPVTNAVEAAWPLAPYTEPHAMAMMPENYGLLVACAGKLVMLDRTTGRITASVAIDGWVDKIAYDPVLRTAYCASRRGKISVVAVGDGKLTELGDLPVQPGIGDITQDPMTHVVWITYWKGNECFVQPFTPTRP